MAYRSTKTLSDMSGEDIIDSRDIVSRFEELEGEREDLAQEEEDAKEAAEEAQEAVNDAEESDDMDSLRSASIEAEEAYTAAQKALAEWDEENGEEFEALKEINDEGESNFPDWKDGATLIRDDYFTEHAEEMVKDIGDMPRDIPSYIEIDWEATAANLKADYSTIEIDGTDYYCRS